MLAYAVRDDYGESSRGARYPYLSGVETSALNSGQDVSLAADVQTLSKGLVDGGLVFADNGGDGLHLLGLELQVGRVSTDSDKEAV